MKKRLRNELGLVLFFCRTMLINPEDFPPRIMYCYRVERHNLFHADVVDAVYNVKENTLSVSTYSTGNYEQHLSRVKKALRRKLNPDRWSPYENIPTMFSPNVEVNIPKFSPSECFSINVNWSVFRHFSGLTYVYMPGLFLGKCHDPPKLIYMGNSKNRFCPKQFYIDDSKTTNDKKLLNEDQVPYTAYPQTYVVPKHVQQSNYTLEKVPHYYTSDSFK